MARSAAAVPPQHQPLVQQVPVGFAEQPPQRRVAWRGRSIARYSTSRLLGATGRPSTDGSPTPRRARIRHRARVVLPTPSGPHLSSASPSADSTSSPSPRRRRRGGFIEDYPARQQPGGEPPPSSGSAMPTSSLAEKSSGCCRRSPRPPRSGQVDAGMPPAAETCRASEHRPALAAWQRPAWRWRAAVGGRDP